MSCHRCRYFITDDQLELVPECLVEAEAGEERCAVLSAPGYTEGQSANLPGAPSALVRPMVPAVCKRAARGLTNLIPIPGRQACSGLVMTCTLLADPVPSVVYLNDGHFCHLRPWRGSGLAIPVFSMRTKDSVGCGEFLDIKTMVKFVAACGMHVLQVCYLHAHSICNQSAYPVAKHS